MLQHLERPARGEAEGLLVLHHGRGADEHDLLALADALDPERRLLIVAPRGPLVLPGWPGFHWYAVPRVGYPDPQTFAAAHAALAELHDELWQRSGIPPSRTVLGGFSMGTVMSYALGLDGGRPAPAGILAISGFIPTVEGWSPSCADRRDTRVLILHGRHDPVIDVGFARAAFATIDAAGLAVELEESEAAHHVDPFQLPVAAAWLAGTLSSPSPR